MLKKSKSIITIALICLLCFASISTAFATNLNDKDALITQDEDNPVEVAISKVLSMPEGTTIPETKFVFLADPVSVDGDAAKDGPALQNLEVNIPDDDHIEINPVNNIMSVVLETGNIFEGVTFPHAGIYVYDLTEDQDTNDEIDTETNLAEWLSYSPAEYKLTVYVANHSTSGRYVYAVTAEVVKDNDGEDGIGKVDPTPGGDGEDYTYSQLIFRNNYVKTTYAPDPEPAVNSTLFVSKTVVGDFGSREQYFSFDINLTVPDLGQPDIPDFFRAYVVDGNGVVKDITSNAGGTDTDTDDTDKEYPFIKISSSAATTILLKHGQKLVLVDTPVGTGYTVTEAAAHNYIPSVLMTTNGGTSVNKLGVLSQALSTEPLLVGEANNGNSAAFTNTRDAVVPTGLNLNDLPFILLIALGIGTLTIFIVVKTRKEKKS